MHIYTIPTTGEQIKADTLANATIGFPEMAADIRAGRPVIRVRTSGDGYRHLRSHIWAGVTLPSGEFVPAHLTGTDADDNRFVPRVEMTSRDGRLTPAENARNTLKRFWSMADNTPIEWINDRD